MKRLLVFSLALILSSQLMAKVKILDVSSKETLNFIKVEIPHLGTIKTTPELTVRDNIVQISVSNSFVWPKIEKIVNSSSNNEITLTAYQFDKKHVRVRAILPFKTEGLSDQIGVELKNKKVYLTIPNKMTTASRSPAVPTVSKKFKSKKMELDEAYLEKLLAQKSGEKKQEQKSKAVLKDQVNTTLAAGKKSFLDTDKKVQAAENTKNSGFSIMTYFGKFIAFLAVVLALFYGVVQLMKKGVLKKSKLGIFGKLGQVEVLSKTFIEPKKSVVMLKAHKQVFLVGVSDKGMHFLSELDNTAELFKDAEHGLTGQNFDTNLNTASSKDRSFNLKDVGSEIRSNEEKNNAQNDEAILQSLSDKAVAGFDKTEDKVKFSDQIKKKVKNLKSLESTL